MQSKWFEYKEEVCNLRKQGVSMTIIERRYGIPRSTLSGWFKDISLTEADRTRLMKNRQDGWKKARQKAVLTHNPQKQARLEAAEQAASQAIQQLDTNNSALLDLAFAMLYLGEGAKNNATSIANSNPMVLRFVLAVLFKNYNLTPKDIRCDLHLRADQNGAALQRYWANELKLPIECFKYVAYDKRSRNKPTYTHYKGVCVVTCNQIAIQRKLIAVYNQFCTKISDDILGA